MSKKKIDNPKYYEKGHKLLAEWKNPKIDKLKELYEKDTYKARIIFMNNTADYTHFRVMLFKEENGDFSIVRFRRTYGISKTNKMYSHEKRLHTITYTKNKFWIIFNEYGKKYVTHVSLSMLHRIDNRHSKVMLDCLRKRFTWINHMVDENVLADVSFNTIVKNKLYSLKKALRFQYKMPYGPAKIIHAATKGGGYYTATNLKYYMEHVTKIENLKDEWFTDGNLRSLFHDSLKMAKTLDRKINCSWTTRRLKEEHDLWAQIITDVIFIDDDRELKIQEEYIKFGEAAGYPILKTTKELALEGKRNNHCVATYVNKVDNGSCAIYKVGENTLEIVRGRFEKKHPLRIGQIRGYKNSSVPDYLQKDILKEVIRYNKEVVGIECSEEFYKETQSLPFMGLDDFRRDNPDRIANDDYRIWEDNDLPF